MKDSSAYKLSSNFGLLLIGTPKSGKTCLQFAFPNPAILDCDHNLDGALRWAGSPPFVYVDPHESEPHARWTTAMTFMKDAIADPSVSTIIIDGLSHLSNFLQDSIIHSAKASTERQNTVAGDAVMNMSYWRPFQVRMTQLVMEARASGKIFICTCHEELVTDEKSGATVAYRPMIPGSLKNNLSGLFSDVWRTELKTIGDKTDYLLRVAPRNLHQIGNSLGMKESTLNLTGLKPSEVWTKHLAAYFKTA